MRITLLSIVIVAMVVASRPTRAAETNRFTTESLADRLVIRCDGRHVADFVFIDPIVKRPYLANVHTPGGVQVTRTHPPVPGTDAVDHDTMHLGIWLAFGNLNGEDFWRNKAEIRSDGKPSVKNGDDGALVIDWAGTMLRADGSPLARQTWTMKFGAADSSNAGSYKIGFTATTTSDTNDLTFGEMEEMGLGVRMATPLTEKAGGKVTSADGRTGAKTIWGTIDKWVDYGGTIDGRRVGVKVTPADTNVRKSWWHTRDYGVFVANSFGKRSVAAGESAELVVPKGTPLTLQYAVEIYEER